MGHQLNIDQMIEWISPIFNSDTRCPLTIFISGYTSIRSSTFKESLSLKVAVNKLLLSTKH